MNSTAEPYRFHAFEVSLFSAKVRTALRYKQVYFEEVRANLREIIERTGLGFIPIVISPEGETWQDSSEIIDRLEARHPKPPLYPESPVLRTLAALIELYSDEFAITPAMHTRWGTEEGERFTRARFSAMMGSVEAGNRAADAMVKGRFAVGATPEAGPAIEEHLHDSLAALSAHFDAHDFLLGARMSLADCALMGPVHGHYFTDLTSRRLLHETALPVIRWVEFCNAPTSDAQGEWFADDALPDTLHGVLRVMGRDGVEPILASVRQVEKHLDEQGKAGQEVERVAGLAESTLRGTRLARMAQTYSLWMLHRVLDPYRSLPADERARVDAVVAGTGWEKLLIYEPRHRVAKSGFKLVCADS